MASQTNEQSFEASIQRYLAGICDEDLLSGISEPAAGYLSHAYQIGYSKDFNAQYALDMRLFWAFLQNTQSKSLQLLQKNHPKDWQSRVIERFDQLAKKHGILYLLKKGLDIENAHIDLLYPVPLASSSDNVRERFKQNIFSCMRQVRYSRENPYQSIDMAIFINGIPLITLELKNKWTGQNAEYHAQKQYREDRDHSQTLLKFGRCLVHFAVDTDEAYMTTKLDGKNTVFLPFNQGNNLGKGNPPNPNGYKTSYLWEDIFNKENLVDIIQYFIRLDGGNHEPLSKRTLFFPRYHQWDVVKKLTQHISDNGVGHTYLIQHSAGSGKSNSITWAAYQLIGIYPKSTEIPGAKSIEQPLFDSVIVVTDRRLLDRQLNDNINQFAEVKNIVAHADSSADLRSYLEQGKKIIITTIQKFPFVVDYIADLSDKRFAVIIDEAHSSQSGSAHATMNRTMGKSENKDNHYKEMENIESDNNINLSGVMESRDMVSESSDDVDIQDTILDIIRSRKMRGNATYLAFTATPKNTTLEKFGELQSDGSFKPFHLYSMKQAIEEGFILDVLANYTTYKSYYEIQKSIQDNPRFDSQKAQKKLRSYVESHQQAIDIKADIMLEHFIQHVVNTKKLRGKGKGMIVTQNIETAIRYYQAIYSLLGKYKHPFKVLLAFSGTKTLQGVEYTEAGVNGFSEHDTKDQFDTDDYRLLVVANKYLTGFDQPKLCAMYVDKRLDGVQCVQTLSRLNRSSSKLGKRTEDLFILDFFNEIDDIKSAFDPFYTSTVLSGATDINVLHDLKSALDSVGVYLNNEVTLFTQEYFNNKPAAELEAIINTAAERFNYLLQLEHDAKVDFKIKANQFTKIYGQMAAIMPFEMVVWEELFWFLKYLLPKLIVKDKDNELMDDLLDKVNLNTYAIERVKLNQHIVLDSTESEVLPSNANMRGVHNNEAEKNPLDEIINEFNQRFFSHWDTTDEEKRVFISSISKRVLEHKDFQQHYTENDDSINKEIAFNDILKDVILNRRRENINFYKQYTDDNDFNKSFVEVIKKVIENNWY